MTTHAESIIQIYRRLQHTHNFEHRMELFSHFADNQYYRDASGLSINNGVLQLKSAGGGGGGGGL